jgi:hypothetical protein
VLGALPVRLIWRRAGAAGRMIVGVVSHCGNMGVPLIPEKTQVTQN